MTASLKRGLMRAVIVCGLGYFIDVFDIQLFAVLRVPSLTELGVPQDQIARIGGYILNAQMLGMISGAFLWGWLADRHGRVRALYGSILLYSIGTFACAFVHDPFTYGLLRGVTGFGLAGETGAALTIVSELISPANRVWGVILVAGLGYLGPISAIVVSWVAPWRGSYMVAGLLGLFILVVRVRLGESELFKKIQRQNIIRGSLKLFFREPQRSRAINCILLGLPMTFCWFLLNFFSVEISRAVLRDGQTIQQSYALLAFYLGNALGDVFSGVLSQYLRSQRKALAIFYVGGAVAGLGHLIFGPLVGLSAKDFYGVYFFIGCAGGSWPLMNVVFTENFGTNIRATATILFVNIVRALSIPMILIFQLLRDVMPIADAALVIGTVFFAAGFFAIYRMRETHGTHLDYVEVL